MECWDWMGLRKVSGAAAEVLDFCCPTLPVPSILPVRAHHAGGMIGATMSTASLSCPAFFSPSTWLPSPGLGLARSL